MPIFGDGESEVIRSIVIAYLEDKGYLVKSKDNETMKELATQEIMIGALIEVLVNKGHIEREEWEKMVKTQI